MLNSSLRSKQNSITQMTRETTPRKKHTACLKTTFNRYEEIELPKLCFDVIHQIIKSHINTLCITLSHDNTF